MYNTLPRNQICNENKHAHISTTNRQTSLPPTVSHLVTVNRKLHTPPQNSTMSSPALKDLPKVAVDLKSQLEGFSTEKLKNIDTQEKIVLPTAEGKCFDDTHTHTHGSVCQVGRACESIARPN